MVCLGCHTASAAVLCRSCIGSLRPAPDRLLPGGIPLVAGFEHQGPAKSLIHHLKYRGVTVFAEVVADTLADRLPRVPLVPVPRALSRRLKYGVDPAQVLATALSRRIGVPVLEALIAPLHSSRRAGRDHSRRVAPFRTRWSLRSPVIVVDDVVTTGSTVTAVVKSIGSEVVATVAAANVVTRAAVADVAGQTLSGTGLTWGSSD